MTVHHLGPITVHQFPCLSDNYGFLVRDEATGTVAAIDTPDGDEIVRKARELGWKIDFVFNTHWHPDHIGGNGVLKEHGATIVAPVAEGEKIAPRDRGIRGGDRVDLGKTSFHVIDVPGHTLGHIAFHVPEAHAAFVGDTLFSLGCGRMFEGDPETFWTSLLKLRSLPPETVVFCAHEYTAANARFALSVDEGNEALRERAREVETLRAKEEPTVPVRLRDELGVNPFLRADDPVFAAALGLEGASAPEVFAEVRARKDSF